jgi:hypothetical protein
MSRRKSLDLIQQNDPTKNIAPGMIDTQVKPAARQYADATKMNGLVSTGDFYTGIALAFHCFESTR